MRHFIPGGINELSEVFRAGFPSNSVQRQRCLDGQVQGKGKAQIIFEAPSILHDRMQLVSSSSPPKTPAPNPKASYCSSSSQVTHSPDSHPDHHLLPSWAQSPLGHLRLSSRSLLPPVRPATCTAALLFYR